MSEYTLCYWPGIPGRGEFVRLAFEYAEKPYEQDLDPKSFMKYQKDPSSTVDGEPYALAPPYLLHNGHVISQTPNILLYIGDALGLSGSKPFDKFAVNALTLTILDINNEIHDTHHPISVSAYYEDQKDEAKRRALSLRTERLPKFLGYFAAVIRSNGGGKSGLLVGDKVTYADLALFQIVDGLRFAYPRAMKRFEASAEYNELFQLEKLLREFKTIAEYMKSDRRLPYSQGIFRYYPELDDEEGGQ